MATLLKRPGPKGTVVWQAQVRKKGYPARIKTFDRKNDAQSWAKKLEHEMETGLWKDTSEAGETSLAEMLDRYLRDVTPSKRKNSQRSEHQSSKYLRQGLGKYSLLQK